MDVYFGTDVNNLDGHNPRSIVFPENISTFNNCKNIIHRIISSESYLYIFVLDYFLIANYKQKDFINSQLFLKNEINVKFKKM